MKKTFKKIFKIFKGSFKGFLDDNAMKLSASLAYYTIFSLGPLLIIIMTVVSFFFGREAVQGKVYGQIKGLVGSDAALQIQQIIKNIESSDQHSFGAMLGISMLIIGATVIFTEIQDSINFIWSVKAKPKKGWLKYLRNRLLSFSLIVSLGFLLLVSLLVSSLLDLLSERLKIIFADYTVFIFYVVNMIIVFFVITGLFAVIFKVLPDAKIRWKDALVGAGFTALLFIIGKFLIGFYLGNSQLGATYGAAASIMILFVWVYYSAIILYFGAEFTKAYAMESGDGIQPTDTAVFIIKEETREVPMA
ncbi:MAG TPA: YihY/virulence factor BrkB family protein [Chitinophagaceae bacterium]